MLDARYASSKAGRGIYEMYLSLSVSVILTLALVGCTAPEHIVPQGVLEVSIELPPADGSEMWARIQLRQTDLSSTAPELLEEQFLPSWDGAHLPGVPLELGVSSTVGSSIVLNIANSEDDESRLMIKVRFCKEQECDELEDARAPEAWYHLEEPFYAGVNTHWSTAIPAIPPAPEDGAHPSLTQITKCEIAGCPIMGTTRNCIRPTQHNCERPDLEGQWRMEPVPEPEHPGRVYTLNPLEFD